MRGQNSGVLMEEDRTEEKYVYQFKEWKEEEKRIGE
jgi:hypothetical protein